MGIAVAAQLEEREIHAPSGRVSSVWTSDTRRDRTKKSSGLAPTLAKKFQAGDKPLLETAHYVLVHFVTSNYELFVTSSEDGES